MYNIMQVTGVQHSNSVFKVTSMYSYFKILAIFSVLFSQEILFDKGANLSQWGKESLFNKGC